jgi:nickel-dependent lactate racemase
MRTIKIPYDKGTIDLHVEEKNLEAVVVAKMHDYKAEKGEAELVEDALSHPIGTKTLSELSKGRKKVTIVTSDHTRAVPSKITLPILLKEIRKGNPDADITILIATGLHRPTTKEEQRAKFGDEIVDHEKIVSNNAFDDSAFTKVCDLPSGAEFYCNKIAVECDLLITEGFIEPHFFAGFSGGRKSILPGIANAATVNENHSYKQIADIHSTTGVLEGNPLHKDMVVAARAVNVQFIMNVALDAEKKIIAAWAGDLEKAHAAGVEFIRKWSQCKVIPADIVVTSNGGYPLDQNLYQSPKAVATAEVYAGEDGVIVMCCGCRDGMGGKNFGRLITMGTPEEIDAYLSKIPSKESISEQWCPQIYSRILRKHKMILVTTYLDPETVRKANMIPAASADEAMEIAYKLKGKDARVVVIPDGVSVMAVKGD